MSNRSAFFAAILVIVSIAQVKLPRAAAQMPDGSDSDCSSGVSSSVDGNCIGEDQSMGTDQQQNGSQGYSVSGAPTPLTPLGQQYPGLQQSQGMNGRVPFFNDRSGLTSVQAEQQALYEEQALALEKREPPTDFQQLVRGSLGKLLPVYGDSLFRQVPTTFFPLRETPVTPDYVLGPGDQLIIRIWGQVNFNAQVTVDRSGGVYLPHIGEIHVAGLPYSQLQQHLHDDVARIYRNFNLSVELGQLRSIQVFVVGQARRPGTYTLSSLSTLVTALFSTGGPSVQGSLRDIQLIRSGQTIAHFDLYDLLIKGDKSKDVSLLPGDVIYIPPAGPQVAVGGNVRNPAIYELKGVTTVDQAIQFAGGLSTTASLQHASLQRIDEHKDRTVVGISLAEGGGETPMMRGDVLRILPISPEFQNVVTLRGNVAEPGIFSWHPGMKLSDILPDSKALITRDYWERRNQMGIPGPEFKPEYALNPDYYLRNPNGAVRTYRYPPRRGINNSNQANGNQTQGQSQNQSFSNSNTGPISTLDQDQQPNQEQDQGQDYQGQDQGQGQNGGQIYDQNCYLNPSDGQNQNSAQGNNYNSSGSQNNPQYGRPCSLYSYSPANGAESSSRENLPRPPLRVTLPVPAIDWSYAVIERFNKQTLTSSLVPFNPGALVLQHQPSQDLALEPGDMVTIFSQADIEVPQAQRTKYVRLEGEFRHAGIYSVQPGETLRQLVARAGGLTPDAYLFGSNFTRESTRMIQQQRLNDYLSHLEVEIDAASAVSSANAVTPQDENATQAELAASRSLVARFRLLRATGRVVLNVPPNAIGLNQIPDLPLEDGDRFTVPSRPSTVNVVGSVYNQNSFIFQQTRLVKAYLRLAGGPSGDADDKHAFIIRADGSVVSRSSQTGVFGNTFESTRLDPGDTLVIPEKVPRATILRNLVNYTQIFSQLALGAAAIAVLQ